MKTFKKLAVAFEACLDTQFTYAVNYKNSVSSFFVNATEKDFWNEYMLQGPRNNYEIIRVDRPCHLYLDLDKNNKEYPNVDIEKVWERLKLDIINAFTWLNVRTDTIEFIKLSSHSDKKQSLHIIVKAESKIFSNLLHCGIFVELLKKELIHGDNPVPLYAKIVDSAVYTKNRCFRMLGCTKGGQKRYLISDKPLTFEHWKECKIQPLKWNGGANSMLQLTDEVKKPIVCTSSYIPQLVIDIMVKLNKDAKFLAHSGPLQLDRIHHVPNSIVFTCDTSSRKCPIAKKIHSTNVPFIVLNLEKGEYFFKCRSKKIACLGKHTDKIKFMNPMHTKISF